MLSLLNRWLGGAFTENSDQSVPIAKSMSMEVYKDVTSLLMCIPVICAKNVLGLLFEC